MPIDPSIPLAVNPAAMAGPDPIKTLSLAAMAQKMRVQNQAIQAQNALRTIFSDPKNLDASGNPTPDALRQIMSIDPNTGMQVQNNILKREQTQLGIDATKTELFSKKLALGNEVGSQALTEYEQAVKSGTPEPQAREIAQKIYSEGLDRMGKSGLFSEQDMTRIPSSFDPMRARAGAMKYKDWVEFQNKQREETRADTQLGLNVAAGKRAAAEFAEKEAGLKLDDAAIDEAARDYITTGKLPPSASRQEISKIISRAPELRKQGITSPKQLGNPVPVAIKNPDGTQTNTMAVYDKENAQWLSATGHAPIAGQVIPAKEAREEAGVISDKAANFIADRILAGDPNATKNMSRTKDSMVKVENSLVDKAIAKYGDGPRAAAEIMIATAGVKGDQTSLSNLTKMTDAAVSFEQTASKNFDLALELAPKAVPTNWGPFINRWVMKGETELGNKDVPPYVTAMLTGANEYAKIMSGSTGAQGSTVDSRREAAELFSPYLSKGQIGEVIKIAKRDMANRKASLGEQIGAIKERMGEESAPRPDASQADFKKKATDAWGSYEPDKYEYGINPSTGAFARRLKSGETK